MITADEIQQPRTPTELREFVASKRALIEANAEALRSGILKEGIYKEFVDEIMPLGRCAFAIYSDECRIRPILGNQGYDAEVLDAAGNVVDKIEVTAPKFGAEDAADARLVVSRGGGKMHVWDDDSQPLAALCPLIVSVAQKKAEKDYSDCTLLIVAATKFPPHESEKPAISKIADCLVKELQKISFRAKRVLLDVAPLCKVFEVQ